MVRLMHASATLLAAMTLSSSAAEVTVTHSYAACHNPSAVQQFEEFERKDDDQGYKQLYFSTAASGECIFLRAGEILESGEARDRWIA